MKMWKACRSSAGAPVGEERHGSLRMAVRACGGEVEVLLVLQRLGRGPKGAPVLLVLVELLEPFEDDDERAECRGEGRCEVECGDHGDRGRRQQLRSFDPFESAVVEAALVVV